VSALQPTKVGASQFFLEDDALDVLRKTVRALGMQENELLNRACVSKSQWANICSGTGDEDSIRKLAAVLGLHPDSLVCLWKKETSPWRDIQTPEGLYMAVTPFGDMTVNAYLVFNPESKDAVMFDTGSDASPLLDFVAANGLSLKALFLTHAHGDHIFEMDRVIELTGIKAYISELEPIAGAEVFSPAAEPFMFGGLEIFPMLTSGHSTGSTSYLVKGLPVPLAAVGDAIFAGSMGKMAIAEPRLFHATRQTIEDAILSQQDQTILCPGHGPLTTVGIEKKHNPFWAPLKIEASDKGQEKRAGAESRSGVPPLSERSGGILPPKEAGKDARTTFSSFVVFARTW